MEARGWTLYNVLVNRYHPKDAPIFLGSLAQEDAAELQKHQVASRDPQLVLASPAERLIGIHYSWLTPILQQSAEPLRSLLLASLPEEQRGQLCRVLQQAPAKKSPPAKVRTYLLNQLAAKIIPGDLLPVAYLPITTLSPLAGLSKEALIQLIDYLGLRDLAEALRSVVNKKLLQAVHSCLQAPDLQLLKNYLQQREKLKVPKLVFDKWDGKRDSLRLLYHQRGLARLAKALAGQPREIIWHVLHHLDRRRATLIESQCPPEAIPGVTPILVQQTISILEFLKRQTGE